MKKLAELFPKGRDEDEMTEFKQRDHAWKHYDPLVELVDMLVSAILNARTVGLNAALAAVEEWEEKGK